jgi:hypothetical protein
MIVLHPTNVSKMSFVVFLALVLFPLNVAVGAYGPTNLTPTYFSVNGNQAFILSPTNTAGGAVPWVWYAPTLLSATTPYPDGAADMIFQSLVNNGIAVVGVDAGESYGSPAGRAIFNDFYTYATSHYNLTPKAEMMGQSRGGLMMYNWAADSGNAEKVSAIAGIYPVVDVTSWPGLGTSTASQAMYAAYGMTQAEFSTAATATVGNTVNPIYRMQPLAQAGIPLFAIAGGSDTTVPTSQNSQALYAKYTALGGSMEMVVVPNRGHEEIPQYFASLDLLKFMLAHTGGSATAPTAISLAPSADAQIRASSPTSNQGTAGSMSLSCTSGGDRRQRSIIKFDLGSIPAGRKITSASLVLTNSATSSGTMTCYVYRVIRDWTETGVTWNKFDGVNAWTNPGGDAVGVTGAQLSNPYAAVTLINGASANTLDSIDITQLVKDWYAGTANYGLLLDCPTEATGIYGHYWNTKEGSTSGYWPQLVVTYSPLPEPSAFSLMAAGLAAGLIFFARTWWKRKP